MTAPPTRRPWRKRKRTWAAIVFWLSLPVLYLLSIGPHAYCAGRGWIAADEVTAFYRPAVRLAEWSGQKDLLAGYAVWCHVRGLEAASD